MSTSTSDALSAADLERLVRAESPDLADAVLALLEQPEQTPEKPLPKDAFTFDALLRTLTQARAHYESDGRRQASSEAWQRYRRSRTCPALLAWPWPTCWWRSTSAAPRPRARR
ncbi:hypothetical protein QEG98_00765 [Myxococcus sp. MxC21-1]|uniref:hypothetical protein n=1 Tax=Myxococcus sp. MxC21-1 TaxID=3041439 RepID=UPI00292D39D4|nr:hypothetical protein [Myxococcus sp. MxC21-1]WNZ62420.1 hypothetical protein QEG98_00765 [Myxococcus sp. MxC21-1]